jgi:hypothetical protein
VPRPISASLSWPAIGSEIRASNRMRVDGDVASARVGRDDVVVELAHLARSDGGPFSLGTAHARAIRDARQRNWSGPLKSARYSTGWGDLSERGFAPKALSKKFIP